MMKVLTSNKQEKVLEHLLNIVEATFEDDFEKRTDAVADAVVDVAVIVGGEELMLRLSDNICIRMKAKRSK